MLSATTQPSGQPCSLMTPFFLLRSDSLNPRIICHQRCLVLKEAERVSGLGEGAMRSRKGWRRIEEVKNWELCGRRESSAPAIPLTSCPFRICWLRKIHNSKIMVHCLWFSSLSIRGDLNIPFEPSPQGGHCSFLFPLVFTAWIQHTMLGIHHLAALYFVFMPRKFFS